KYGALEKASQDLGNSKVEANVEKRNSLLDTVQQLQLTNEVFRKQLMDTINYVQLRYLTQVLDAAEHITSQKQTRAMSNSFLSDMLSRGVKKTGPLQPKNTCTMATQTPPAASTSLQLRQQQLLQQQVLRQLNPSEGKLSKSFTFSSSLFNLTGNNDENGIKYKLRGGALSYDRSQVSCQPIPPVVVREPDSPDSVDILAVNRGDVSTLTFLYASPTTSQLHIVVPDDPSERRTISNAGGSQAGSVHHDVVGTTSTLSVDG
ncbi:hypothetical protein BGZ80_007751, partial [Entomortierella chlamydospora]